MKEKTLTPSQRKAIRIATKWLREESVISITTVTNNMDVQVVLDRESERLSFIVSRNGKMNYISYYGASGSISDMSENFFSYYKMMKKY